MHAYNIIVHLNDWTGHDDNDADATDCQPNYIQITAFAKYICIAMNVQITGQTRFYLQLLFIAMLVY